MSNTVYIQNLTYHYRGLNETDKYLAIEHQEDEFHKNAVYNPALLKVHIKKCTDGDDINSMISRCIEHNLPESLDIILEYLPNIEHVDKRLLLRRISDVKLYLKAKLYGFIDNELEKRIVLIQRLFRKTSSNNVSYTGPTWDEYLPDRYWGYRHTIYYLRWNRYQRYKCLKFILREGPDCRYEAYKDFIESIDFKYFFKLYLTLR